MQDPKNLQDDVYTSLSNLMHCPTELAFEARYQELIMMYSMHQNIVCYITNGWCGPYCMWRARWRRFGRLFNHGNVDTTNLVERLWQYIKYTLLDARINRSILELLHALVGDSKTGDRIGGTLLRFFQQKQEIGIVL